MRTTKVFLLWAAIVAVLHLAWVAVAIWVYNRTLIGAMDGAFVFDFFTAWTVAAIIAADYDAYLKRKEKG